ncbi:MAG: hypothetical protein LBU46_01400, partial [Candidatus Accumulibacter sp.]|nr:hypothetical protein [Accumulibacter sp.]
RRRAAAILKKGFQHKRYDARRRYAAHPFNGVDLGLYFEFQLVDFVFDFLDVVFRCDFRDGHDIFQRVADAFGLFPLACRSLMNSWVSKVIATMMPSDEVSSVACPVILHPASPPRA